MSWYSCFALESQLVTITVYIWCKAQTPMSETRGMHLLPVLCKDMRTIARGHANSWLSWYCVSDKVSKLLPFSSNSPRQSIPEPHQAMWEEEAPFAHLEPATGEFHLMPFPCAAGAAVGRHSLGTFAICFTGFCHPFLIIFFSSLKTNNFSLLYLD